MHGDSNTGMVLTRADSLKLNAGYTPIPHNGAVEGFQMFYVPISVDELKRLGWTMTLFFIDIKRHEYSTSYKATSADAAAFDSDQLQRPNK
jgi:hypothetical protein